MKLTGPVTFIYINKYSKTEILAFLLLTQLIGDRTSCDTPLSPIIIINSASNFSEIKIKKIYIFKHNLNLPHPPPPPNPLALDVCLEFSNLHPSLKKSWIRPWKIVLVCGKFRGVKYPRTRNKEQKRAHDI